MIYYGPDGEPILDVLEWAELFERRSEDMSPESWWRKFTQIAEGTEVSTVWMGIDHAFSLRDKPLIWETMIFGGKWNEYCWRYSSRQEAFDDHERIVGALRENRDPALVAQGVG